MKIAIQIVSAPMYRIGQKYIVPALVIRLFIVVVFPTDLRSDHDYLRELYDLCTHCEKHLLQPVDGGNQSLHPSNTLGTLTKLVEENIHTCMDRKKVQQINSSEVKIILKLE